MYRCLAIALLGATALSAATPAEMAAARALFEGRKLAESQAAFERLAASDPKDPEVNYYLGQLALRRNDFDKGVQYFEAAVAAAPNTGRYQHGLGEACGRKAEHAGIFSGLGLARRCLAAYQRAVEIEPDNLEFRECLFEFYRQAPGIIGGGFDKAAAQAAAIKKIDAARGRIAFARLYAGEKKFAEAFGEFEEVLQANPNDFEALFQIGRLAVTTGRNLDRGIVSLRRCLELPAPTGRDSPTHAVVHWRLGQLLEKLPDSEGARKSYAAAVRLDPALTPAVEALQKMSSGANE